MSVLVSVVIPCFNAERFLGATIESALGQSHVPIEVIVVDDGSTDGSLSIARRYEPFGVRVVAQPNCGAAAARNTGLRLAAGEFIQYLDGDDLLSPDKVAEQVALLNRFDSGWLASCAWGRFVGRPTTARFEPQPVWADLEPVDWLVSAWEGGGMMGNSCWLVPRAIAGCAGLWDERLSLNDDGEYFCRVLLASRGVKFVPRGRVFYRSGLPQSLSRQKSPQAIASLLRTYELYRQGILAVEDSPRTRHACAVNFASFVYEMHPHYPELLAKARAEVRALGFRRFPIVGGERFRSLAHVVGFDAALFLRRFLAATAGHSDRRG